MPCVDELPVIASAVQVAGPMAATIFVRLGAAAATF